MTTRDALRQFAAEESEKLMRSAHQETGRKSHEGGAMTPGFEALGIILRSYGYKQGSSGRWQRDSDPDGHRLTFERDHTDRQGMLCQINTSAQAEPDGTHPTCCVIFFAVPEDGNVNVAALERRLLIGLRAMQTSI